MQQYPRRSSRWAAFASIGCITMILFIHRIHWKSPELKLTKGRVLSTCRGSPCRGSINLSLRSHTRVRCSEAGAPSTSTLALYTKPDCPLCSSMERKVQGLIDRAKFLPSPLSNVEFMVRDISTNSNWASMYNNAVPVVVVMDGATEEPVSVLPRITADKLEREIISTMNKIAISKSHNS
uniref:Glutaredoxin-like protein n=1 Tax=Lotharella globosa TaxID=91324 RepID=A0A7S3Z9J5_9EUKA|mmetsp:Transcript_15556/g.31532  ORF Transcript_15556/g.31532 Transcript_15556/m.31532 type:complete len:180 (+) Transcript_15556:58-597(+)